jgi:hypothetical protein
MPFREKIAVDTDPGIAAGDLARGRVDCRRETERTEVRGELRRWLLIIWNESRSKDQNQRAGR